MAIDAPERLKQLRHADAHAPSTAEIEAMVHAHYDAIYRLALSILHDADEADDATQETFIAAAGALDRYRGEASVKTWLFSIAVNQCRALLRKRKRRRRLHDALHAVQSLVGKPSQPEDAAVQTETEQQLHDAVRDLPEKHRLPILLRYVHNMTAPEIARILEINEGTVHSRLHYARRQLRRKLKGQR